MADHLPSSGGITPSVLSRGSGKYSTASPILSEDFERNEDENQGKGSDYPEVRRNQLQARRQVLKLVSKTEKASGWIPQLQAPGSPKQPFIRPLPNGQAEWKQKAGRQMPEKEAPHTASMII